MRKPRLRDTKQLAQSHQPVNGRDFIWHCLLPTKSLFPFGQSPDLSWYLLDEGGFISGKVRLVLDIGVGM